MSGQENVSFKVDLVLLSASGSEEDEVNWGVAKQGEEQKLKTQAAKASISYGPVLPRPKIINCDNKKHAVGGKKSSLSF